MSRLNLDKLLEVYCEGIYAMDPKTALPFWDYDFGPLYGDLWIKKMLLACHLARDHHLTSKEVSDFFENIAVPRKELIYSLWISGREAHALFKRPSSIGLRQVLP